VVHGERLGAVGTGLYRRWERPGLGAALFGAGFSVACRGGGHVRRFQADGAGEIDAADSDGTSIGMLVRVCVRVAESGLELFVGEGPAGLFPGVVRGADGSEVGEYMGSAGRDRFDVVDLGGSGDAAHPTPAAPHRQPPRELDVREG
jgi:hypothetical protein